MKYNNIKSTLLLGLISLTYIMSSCQKQQPIDKEIQSIDLPKDNTVIYGKKLPISLPEDYVGDLSTVIVFDVSKTTDVTINGQSTLRQKLLSALYHDKENNKIVIDSKLIFPNAASSITSDNKIPEKYVVTLNINSDKQVSESVGEIEFTVTPSVVVVDGAKEWNDNTFAYGLYDDEAVSFALSAPDNIVDNNTSWHIEASDKFSIEADKLTFNSVSSEGKGENETKLDCNPTLAKDGFAVAITPFQMIYIPQIKYLFGAYYPDLGITINTSTLVIGLGEGFLSSAPVFYPEKYANTFRLNKIELNGTAFKDQENLFEVEEATGRVRVKKSSTLIAGSYKVYVEALSTTGLKFETTLILKME